MAGGQTTCATGEAIGGAAGVPDNRREVGEGSSTGLPKGPTHCGNVWTWDFIADATQRGGSLRILTVVDKLTRECHVLRPDRVSESGRLHGPAHTISGSCRPRPPYTGDRQTKTYATATN